MNQTKSGRCLNCRGEVPVPDSYTDGSLIGCGTCNIQLRIVRTGGLRLVISDLVALRDQLRESRANISQTRLELNRAQASWGIGVNGLGLGVLYVVARVALEERELNQGLIVEAVVLAIVSGLLLELANHLFLSKRATISRLSAQMRQAVADQREIERKIKESSRR